MQDQQLEVKNIKISGAEDVQWGIKLKSENGGTYNVSKTLKDKPNEETKAWQAIKDLPGYGMGLEKCLKFVTVDNKQGGKSRYVRIIGEPETISSAQKINQSSRDIKVEKANGDVQDNIRWCNALNNSCLIVSHADKFKLEDTKTLIEQLANWIYNLEPQEDNHPQSNYPEQGGHVNEFPPDDEEAVEEGIRNM